MRKFTTLILLMLLCATVVFGQAPEKFNYQAVVRNASDQLMTNASVGVRVSILQGSTSGSTVYVETQTVATNANGLMTLEIGGGNVQLGTFANINWANGPYFLKTETDPNGGTNYSITSTQQMLSVPYALYAKDAGNGFSGDYNDLTNTPTIPTVPTNVSAFSNDAGYITGYTETDPQYNAWDKDYNDLINKPTIPTVPTNVSAFTNDAGYITMDSVPTVPTNVSAFNNDAGYITGYTETDPQFNAWNKDYNDLINKPTIPAVPENVSAFNNDVPYLTVEQQILSISNDTIFLTGGSFVKLPASFSGDYNDLTNKPEIPEIPEIPEVPDSVSAFINDAGYITMSDIQALLDELNNAIDSLNNRLDSLENGQTPTPPEPEFSCGTSTVSDYDGNVYHTVKIGEQCWMKENLRTTKYADGSSILFGESSLIEGYYYDYGSSNISLEGRGYLYNWAATMHGAAASNTNPSGVQGVCPTGWHVPSDAEWTQLSNYVSSQSHYLCGSDSSYIAKALSAKTDWNSSNGNCVVGNILSANNATGFNALPAGHYGSILGTLSYGCSESGNEANFWSSTLNQYYSGVIRRISYSSVKLMKKGVSREYYGASVRCLKDESNPSPAAVTLSASDVTENSATLNGFISNPGNAAISAQGFEWKATNGASYTQVEVEETTMTYSLTGLTANTLYTYRAFVTYGDTAVYGEEMIFTTVVDGQPCPGASNVTDYDGNTYNTVQIGNQCWMKENLRTTHYADGSAILAGNGTSVSLTEAFYYIPNGTSSSAHGYFYSWPAVMQGATSSSSNPSNVRGICPIGWHVPSDAEWTQLTHYVGSQSQYRCSDEMTYIAKALSSNTGWRNSTNSCAVGNEISTNNATGFSALPTNYGGNDTSYTYFWSATEGSYGYVTCRYLSYSNADVTRYSDDPYGAAYSVRCLRDESSTTFTNPTVSTDSATNVTETSAALNGTISNPDNVTITAQGFVWKATDGGTYTQVATNGTSMIYTLTDLTANTAYIYKAFITYEGTTVYGEEVMFTTLATSTPVDGQPCSGASTVTDYDGNVYNTVQIGNQCWMRDNLRTTYYADGTAIPAGETNTDATLPYYYDYISSDIPLTQRGYLYNWPAVMRDASSSSANPSGVQGICPTGWHVPSDEEWTQLTNYVSAQNEYLCSDNAEFIAKVLASITGWSSSTSTCAVGNLQNLNNATGFNASPAGYLYNLGFTNSGKYAYFWTSTAASSTNAWYRSLNFNYAYVYRNNYGKHFGYSVRCLRDEGGSSTVQLPTVTTATMSDITANSATSGGNVTSDGGATVTARGVCWSTSQNPTVSDDHTTDGSGTGSFTANLANLTPGTTYYVRAYATNSMGTAYGNEESFTTTAAALPQDGQPCVGAATVTDYDGHTYNTVQLGSQCWMAENLRTTHYSDGTAIPTGDGWSSTEPLYYTLEDSLEHGYLYNWRAVMHNSSSSQANPSGVQGVCPTGWHVPSDAEWTELETYVGGQSQYLCNNDSSYIAKALASTIGWSSCTNTCAVGNTPGSNNATGFSAVPAGYRDESSYSTTGENASFWSSTENSSSIAYYRYLDYINADVYRTTYYKNDGFSVRCLRD